MVYTALFRADFLESISNKTVYQWTQLFFHILHFKITFRIFLISKMFNYLLLCIWLFKNVNKLNVFIYNTFVVGCYIFTLNDQLSFEDLSIDTKILTVPQNTQHNNLRSICNFELNVYKILLLIHSCTV